MNIQGFCISRISLPGEVGKLLPLCGNVIVELKSKLQANEGGIVIPESVRGQKDYNGKVVAVYLKEGNGKGANIPHAELLDKTVILDTYAGRQFDIGDRSYLIVPAKNIAAIVEGAENIAVAPMNSIERCRYCRSKGEGNMILDHDGRCPTCGRDKNGQYVKTWDQMTEQQKRKSVKVSRREHEHMNPEQRKAKGTAMHTFRKGKAIT